MPEKLSYREEDFRDQCAMRAMAPIISRTANFAFNPESYDDVARHCYALADAMLKERTKQRDAYGNEIIKLGPSD